MSELDDFCEEIGLGRLAAGALRSQSIRLLSILGAEIALGAGGARAPASTSVASRNKGVGIGNGKHRSPEEVAATREALVAWVTENPGSKGPEMRAAVCPELGIQPWSKAVGVLMKEGRLTRRGNGGGSIWLPGNGKIRKASRKGGHTDKGAVRAEIVEFLKAHGEPMRASDIQTNSTLSCAKSTFYGILTDLVDEGQLTKTGTNVSTRYSVGKVRAVAQGTAPADGLDKWQRMIPEEKLVVVCGYFEKNPGKSGTECAAHLKLPDGTYHIKGILQKALKNQLLKKKGDRNGTVYHRTKRAIPRLVGTPQSPGGTNVERLLGFLKKHPGSSTGDIQKGIDAPQKAVTSALHRLLGAKTLKRTGKPKAFKYSLRKG